MISIELVNWVDSCAHPGWKDGDFEPSVSFCQSAGFLHSEDENQITLALSRSADGRSQPWGELITIPKACITKRTKWKLKTKS